MPRFQRCFRRATGRSSRTCGTPRSRTSKGLMRWGPVLAPAPTLFSGRGCEIAGGLLEHNISIMGDRRFAGIVGIGHDGDTRHKGRLLAEGFFEVHEYIALLVDPLIDERRPALDHDELAAAGVWTRHDGALGSLARPDIVDRDRRVLSED